MDDLISRQAVKELAHNQMREKYCGMALKKQRDFYIKLADSIIDLLPAVHPEPHWIPVTERLPEKNRVVVVCGEKGTWEYGTYRGHGDNIHFWYWKKNTIKRVYWWMYKEDALPEPYKGATT